MNRITASLILFFFPLTITHAASSPWVKSGDNRMRLIVSEPQTFDKNIRATLEVDLASGWKTYWQNPGDAGVPLKIDFSKSINAQRQQVYFPAPKRFDDGVSVWAGYDSSVSFPIKLERGETSRPSHIKAHVFIGLCNKICIPFETDLLVVIGNNPSNEEPQVGQAFNNLPKPATIDYGVQSIKFSKNRLIINVIGTAEYKGNAASPPVHLFLNPPMNWQLGAPKLMSSKGRHHLMEAEILLTPKSDGSENTFIDYTLYMTSMEKNPKDSVSGRIQLKH
jgi:DsbC/DsbD-like thiol-disulfide interchange protein